MALDIGGINGLAQNFQFDQRINDLRYREQQTQRSKAMAEAKASLFADDLNYQNAINSHDNPLIKAESQATIKKIGQYVRENPDYATNLDKRIQLNELKRSLKDSPTLHRGLASDNSYKQYLQDLAEVAKNPQQHDTDAYNQIQDEWKNYLQYGNQYGKEAADAQGKQAFVYTKPRDFVDLNKSFQDVGNGFKDMATRSIKGGRNAYEEYAKPDSLRTVANQMYQQNKRQIDLEARKNGVDPLAYVETAINAHIPKKRDFGDYGLSDGIALANYKKRLDGLDREVNAGQSAYQQAFVNAPQGVVNPAFLEQTYGSKPRNVIYDNKGTNQIDNTGNRVFYTGAHRWVETKDRTGKPQKQKLVEVYSYLTPDQAKENGIIEDPFGPSGANGTDFEVVPEWNKQAEFITNENSKGEPVPMVKVKAFMPVELNSAYAGAFDNEVHIAKSKLMGSQPNEGQTPQTVIQNGYEYHFNAKTGKYE